MESSGWAGKVKPRIVGTRQFSSVNGERQRREFIIGMIELERTVMNAS
jgi:hypothetical protein